MSNKKGKRKADLDDDADLDDFLLGVTGSGSKGKKSRADSSKRKYIDSSSDSDSADSSSSSSSDEDDDDLDIDIDDEEDAGIQIPSDKPLTQLELEALEVERFDKNAQLQERREMLRRLKERARQNKEKRRAEKAAAKARSHREKKKSDAASAMKDLVARRKAAKKKQKKGDDEQEYIDDDNEIDEHDKDDQDDDDDYREGPSSSSSSSSSKKDRSRRRSSASTSSSSSSGVAGVHSSTTGSSSSRSPPRTPALSLEKLLAVQVRRDELMQWIEAPFLQQRIIGLLVRINIGYNENKKKTIYRIAEIRDIQEQSLSYRVDGRTTRQYLRIKCGAFEKTFRIEYVSNKRFEQDEVDWWAQAMTKGNLPLPSEAKLDQMHKDLDFLRTHRFTDEEIDALVANKRDNFKFLPTKAAARKAFLMHLRLSHMDEGNIDGVRQCDEELAEIDEQQKERREYVPRIDQIVANINSKNKNANFEQIYKSKISIQEQSGKGLDPFVRRNCAPEKVVFSKANSNDSSAPSVNVEENKPNSIDADKDEHDLLTVDSNWRTRSIGLAPSKAAMRIAEIHADGELDLDLDLSAPSSVSIIPVNNTNTEETNNDDDLSNGVALAQKRSRPSGTLSLNDYKRRRGIL